MPDFLEEKKREISARLSELRPLVEEFRRLEQAAAALEGVPPGREGAETPARRTRRRAAASGSGRSGTGRRGRPRGSGTRSKQALELVRSRPGITIPEIAQAIGIQQNYLYRVLPSLQKDGLVRKEGRGWHAKEAA
jgi:sugar-specific transcriptional regulator TrmB